MTETRVRPYEGAAAGWPALAATARAVLGQGAPLRTAAALLRMNQPDGFDCPGCGWADPSRPSTFEFCENGAKALAWEATERRCSPEFFAAHTVAELSRWPDHALEAQGRLTHPMAYDPATDTYVPVAWEEAFARIGAALRAVPRPGQVEFYTSGRASNEASFLYQLFARAYGANNFPDCSNMCQEPTSVGLPRSIGVGKGTVLIEDFDAADAIFIFGQNPGTNSPRMLTSLRNAARRGARIVSFNPLKEPALERFRDPQSVVEMSGLADTPISTHLYQLRVGGDAAALKGVMKACLEADDAARASGDAKSVLDWDFIREHTEGFEALAANLRATSWEVIERRSGLSRAELEVAARIYLEADACILVYGMGLTQHHDGTENVRQIANLALLRGNVGRKGAGICPVRGHSNVQGNRTCGLTEKPSAALLDRLRDAFGFEPPRAPGHNVAAAIEAMIRGEARAFIGLGGNLAASAPDREATQAAFRRLDLTVMISTKLNRTHLVHGRQAFILPCLARSELDLQASGPQSVTVEDSMSMVHASAGRNPPASPELRSEPAILAGLARATLGGSPAIPWEELVADYARIRDAIERVFPEFEGYNEKIKVSGGFHLHSPARERIWNTPSGKAQFALYAGIERSLPEEEPDALWLTTIRSHDQYNTTVYTLSDRYRGVFGERMVLFLGRGAMARRGLAAGDKVTLETIAEDGVERRLAGLSVVPYDLPDGCCAAYYPEANPLIPLGQRDQDSGTPSSKATPVRLLREAPAG